MSLVHFFTAFRPLDPIPPEPSTPYICAPEILIRTLAWMAIPRRYMVVRLFGVFRMSLEIPGSIPDIMISTTQKYFLVTDFSTVTKPSFLTEIQLAGPFSQ